MKPGEAIPALIRALDRMSRRRLIFALLVAQVLLHLPFLAQPPSGMHLWRQTQTLSVARNFVEEGMNPFQPRVDSRGGSSGITGMEFPLVNFVMAGGYRLFGFSHAMGRLVLLGFSLLALAACFQLLEKRFGSRATATVGTLFLLCSPMFGYYSIVAVPDVTGMAFTLIALVLLDEPVGSGRRGRLALGFVLLTAAGLVKITALIVLPVVMLLLWRGASGTRSRLVRAGGVAAVLGVLGSWYLYARALSAATANHDFKLQSAFPYPLQVVPGLLNKVLLRWLPEFYITYGTFLLFLAGLIVLFRWRGRSRAWEGLYAFGVLALLVAELPMLDEHDYYLMPAIPLLVVVAAHGWEWLTKGAPFKGATAFAGVALLATLALGPARGLNRFVKAPPRADLLALEECLDRAAVGPSARLVAASDKSPSIYLYFMHRKGWAVTDAVPARKFKRMVDEGACYLVSDSRALEQRPEIAAQLGAPLARCGDFTVFPLGVDADGLR